MAGGVPRTLELAVAVVGCSLALVSASGSPGDAGSPGVDPHAMRKGVRTRNNLAVRHGIAAELEGLLFAPAAVPADSGV